MYLFVKLIFVKYCNLDRKEIYSDLSFYYPNQVESQLKDIIIYNNPRVKIAIVGDKGAETSTLIKCLLGLYRAQKGKVFYENIELNQIDMNNIRINIFPIFKILYKERQLVNRTK
jgi:ABC-type bacteriocin/lantibiotic exporter with double-glycine peptidase domain